MVVVDVALSTYTMLSKEAAVLHWLEKTVTKGFIIHEMRLAQLNSGKP